MKSLFSALTDNEKVKEMMADETINKSPKN